MIIYDDKRFIEWDDAVPRNKNVLLASLNKKYSHEDLKLLMPHVIVSCTTGTDHIDNQDIPLLKLEPEDCKDIYSTAEHTMGLMLALLRNTVQSCGDIEKNRDKYMGHTLHGKTLGIVGYGRVGKMVAKYAKCFGMKILTHDKTDPDQNLEDILTHSDIVTCHLKLNRDTRHYFSYNEFELMNGWFINTSRGEIVNTEALAEALENGNVKGAALDVIDKPGLLTKPRLYIKQSDDAETILDKIDNWDINYLPCLEYDDIHMIYGKFTKNVIITPHIGGNTIEDRKATQEIMKRKLVEFLENQK
jgi:D-3-phosphoglycerate dehydrogenase / 2-oxoglutarate reductase